MRAATAIRLVQSDDQAAPLLAQFKGVSKTFRHADGHMMTAVKDVTIDLAKGKMVTILGPSECGQSTLLNMLAGIFSASSSEVIYCGSVVNGLNSRTGYIMQSDHLLPWRTMAGNLRAPLEIRHLDRTAANSRVIELLGSVGLSARLLSGSGVLEGGGVAVASDERLM